MSITQPLISLEKKKLSIKEKRAKLPLPLQVLTSPKTTSVLAGILGTLTGGIFTGAKAFLGTGLGLGILETSPLARKTLKKKILNPTVTGEGIGNIIENPSSLLPTKKKNFKKTVKDITKSAGIGAGITAGLAGGAFLTKREIDKLLKRRRERKERKEKIPSSPTIQPSEKFFVLPSEVNPQIRQPIGVIEQPKEKPIEKPPQIMPPFQNKITFKPEIKVSVNNNFSKRFINQQNLIKTR